MKIITFTYKPTTENIDVINSCIKFLEIDNHTSCDVSLYKPEDYLSKNEDIIFALTFGKIAYLNISQCIQDLSNVKIIQLPQPAHLVQSKENTQNRKDAFLKLKELKQEIENFKTNAPLVIKSQDIEEVDKKQLTKIYKDLASTTTGILFRFTNGNKIIEVSNDPVVDSNGKIVLTLNELFILNSIKETFNVKDIEIIKGK